MYMTCCECDCRSRATRETLEDAGVSCSPFGLSIFVPPDAKPPSGMK